MWINPHWKNNTLHLKDEVECINVSLLFDNRGEMIKTLGRARSLQRRRVGADQWTDLITEGKFKRIT